MNHIVIATATLLALSTAAPATAEAAHAKASPKWPRSRQLIPLSSTQARRGAALPRASQDGRFATGCTAITVIRTLSALLKRSVAARGTKAHRA